MGRGARRRRKDVRRVNKDELVEILRRGSERNAVEFSKHAWKATMYFTEEEARALMAEIGDDYRVEHGAVFCGCFSGAVFRANPHSRIDHPSCKTGGIISERT